MIRTGNGIPVRDGVGAGGGKFFRRCRCHPPTAGGGGRIKKNEKLEIEMGAPDGADRSVSRRRYVCASGEKNSLWGNNQIFEKSPKYLENYLTPIG